MTVKLHDEEGTVVGYLKYGEREAARKRLTKEYTMLSRIRSGLAPEPIKHGALGRGEALLITPLGGRRPPATLTLVRNVNRFLDELVVRPPMPLDDHPWVREIRERSEVEHDRWFEVLAHRDWPVVIQHGDFTSWNLLRKPDGTLGAVDWEYGSLEGFAYLDLAHHILQTSVLLYRWEPSRAAEHAVRYLTRMPWPALERREAEALVRLSAYYDYLKGEEDGKASDSIFPMQGWRRAVWEKKL
jgi:hypothetical protein